MSYSQALEEQVRLIREEHKIWADEDQTAHMTKLSGSLWAMLERADPFYWSPSMSDLICQTSDEALDVTILRPEMIPVPNGFWWFAKPLALPKWHGDCSDMGALVWRVHERGVTIASYHYFWGQHRHQDGRRAIASMGEWDWDFGQPLSEIHDAAISEYGIPVDDWWIVGARLFASGLLFIDQRILVSSQQRAERHARKRLEQQGYAHEPLIRVVELRRKQAAGHHDGEQTAVDWACQWVVSGHWRQQFYPSLNAYQPRWIMPYVKGPEDKPLKPPRAKVFAVVR